MKADGQILPVCVDGIPLELIKLPCWINWKLEPRRTEDGAQRTAKVPYRADGKGRASSTDPESWSSIDDALEKYHKGEASGIGFVFLPENGIVGVDLDGCLDGETLHPAARKIVEQMDSYTELSVSGTGLHILLRAILPWDGKRRDPIELYGKGRYFTLTGQVYEGRGELRENQAGIDKLISLMWPPQRTERRRPEEGTKCRRYEPEAEDGHLLKRARNARNGGKFNRLFAGEWQGDFPSQSEADAGLVSMLYFWTGGDRARTERLFRQSGLYREKFDRKDYADRCFSLCERGRP